MISLLIDQPSDAEQRIDKFIKKYLPEAPLGGIYKWLRVGKIKVNKKKRDETYRIELGDTIDIYLHDEEIQAFQKKEPTHITSGERGIEENRILFEDEYLLIYDKPAGMNVHPGDHKSDEVSLIEHLHDSFAGKYNTLSFRPALVHRIDRDTSGAIMIAKEKATLEALLGLLQNGKIEKFYHALVVGSPKIPKGTITKKLLRKEHAKNEAKVVIDESGQTAITHYRVLSSGLMEKYSLLEARIETGRTHQIRVHFASLGHPILGDKSYGDRGENSFAKRAYGTERQLLHARKLIFTHPKTQKNIEIIAPYPKDFEDILKG